MCVPGNKCSENCLTRGSLVRVPRACCSLQGCYTPSLLFSCTPKRKCSEQAPRPQMALVIVIRGSAHFYGLPREDCEGDSQGLGLTVCMCTCVHMRLCECVHVHVQGGRY